MTTPGSTLTIVDQPVQKSTPTDTGQVIIAGLAYHGSVTTPIPVASLADFVAKCGARQSWSGLYDWIETYFREGGNKALVTRVVGPSATTGLLVLQDITPANTLTVNANGPGVWSSDVKVAVINSGTTFHLTLTDSTSGTVLETTPEFASKTDAVQWAAQNSKYITLVDTAPGTGLPQTLTATVLSAGNDDRMNATDAGWKAALDLVTPDYGPGQVVQCGRSTTQSYTDTLAHAVANNRFAVLDTTDTATVATLVASAAAARATGNGRSGAMYGPWAVVPGLANAPLSTRTVPWSAVQCGMVARSEGAGNSPNVPVAGQNGQAQFVVGVSQPAFSDADRGTLNEASVNVPRAFAGTGVVQTYGLRSLTDPTADPNWAQASICREAMRIKALGRVILDAEFGAQIDGAGIELGKLQGKLAAMLLGEYRSGALYGQTPQDAFAVDVDTVNTPLSISQHKLAAAISARFSPGAETLQLNITNVPITENVA